MSNPILYQLRWINSRLLLSSKDYQREKKDPQIASIVADFSEYIANEPKVSVRNGKYFVFDGQHTVAARVVMNDGKPVNILCKVYNDLSLEDEAYLFSMQTGHASKPSPGERMTARLCAKDDEIERFKAATESAGILIDVNGSLSNGHMRCINTALREFRRSGTDLYVEALSIIYEAWDAVAAALKYDLIQGICRFVRIYHGAYNRTRLVRCLADIEPDMVSDMIKLDFKTPPAKRVVKPFLALYNSVSTVGALPIKI